MGNNKNIIKDKKFNIKCDEYNLLFDHYAIVIHDIDDNILEINDEACQLFGFTRDELLKKNLNDFIPNDSVHPDYKNIILNNRIISLETVIKNNKNNRRNIEVHSKIIDIKNQVIVSRIKDITDMINSKNRIERLKSILYTITHIQRLLVDEKNPDIIIMETCQFLIETRNYAGSCIAIKDVDTGLMQIHSQGGEYQFDKMWTCNSDGKGDAPQCVQEALSGGKIITIMDSKKCDCNYKIEHEHYLAITLPIVIENENIGVLHIAADKYLDIGSEEENLLQNIAHLIATTIEKNRFEIELESKKNKLKESELKYKSLYVNAPMSYQSLDKTGCIIDVNPAWTKTLGYSREDVIGKWFGDFIHPDYLHIFNENFPKFLKNGTVSNVHFKMKHKNGNFVHIELDGRIGTIGNGESVRSFCVFNDITKQQETEEAYRELEMWQQEIVHGANIGLWEWNLLNDDVKFSKEWKLMIGYEEHEIVDRLDEWQKRVHPDDLENTLVKINSTIQGIDSKYSIEFRFQHKDGHYIWIFAQASIIKDKEGKPIKLYGTHIDVSDFKQIEQKLIDSEKRYYSLFDNMNNCVAVYDAVDNGNDFVFKAFNRSAEKKDKLKRENLIGKKVTDIFPGIYEMGMLDVFKRVWKTGKSEFHPMLHYKGNRIQGWRENFVYKLDSGELVAVYDDLTEQKQNEERLKQLSTAVEQSPSIIMITDLEGNIEYVNRKFCEVSGYKNEDVVGKNPRIMKSGEMSNQDYHDLWEKITNNQIWSGELHNKKKTGDLFWESSTISSIFNSKGVKTHYLKVAENITKLKQLESEKGMIEKQRLASQKLETVGTLAGGIAHDFNNILTPILGYSGLMKKMISEDDKLFDEVDEIYKAGLRAKDLISQILSFSSKTETQKSPFNLHLILNEVIKMMRSVLSAFIDIKMDINKNCGKVLIDSTKIHQVIVNIVTNASHAIGNNKGTIKIKMNEIDTRNEKLLDSIKGVSGNYCKLSISDTGCGIEKEIVNKIFDPFFTTKEQGEGTGLGLSVAHGIIREHNGFIFVDSEINEGSTFTIFLPIVEESEIETGIAEERNIIGGHERIMLIDDRIDVTKMAKNMLSDLGYTVFDFNDPKVACEYFAENYDQIDLVLTDFAMPEMSGIQLAEEVRKLKTDIPIIIATGNSSVINKEQVENFKINKVIGKPILLFEISKTIRELLNE